MGLFVNILKHIFETHILKHVIVGKQNFPELLSALAKNPSPLSHKKCVRLKDRGYLLSLLPEIFFLHIPCEVDL